MGLTVYKFGNMNPLGLTLR